MHPRGGIAVILGWGVTNKVNYTLAPELAEEGQHATLGDRGPWATLGCAICPPERVLPSTCLISSDKYLRL